jgi:general secretion pathway protein A
MSPLLFGIIAGVTLLLLMVSHFAFKKKNDTTSFAPQPILYIPPAMVSSRPPSNRQRAATPRDYGIQSLAREIAATNNGARENREKEKSILAAARPKVSPKVSEPPKIHPLLSDSSAFAPDAVFVASVTFPGLAQSDIPISNPVADPIAEALEPSILPVAELGSVEPTQSQTVSPPFPLESEVAESLAAVPGNGDRHGVVSVAPRDESAHEMEALELPGNVHVAPAQEFPIPGNSQIENPVQIEQDAGPDIEQRAAIDCNLKQENLEAAIDDVQPAAAAEFSANPNPPDYLKFYGLCQQPFDVTPDPGYLYLSRVHREALSSISQGVENFRGFMALVAEPGLGKTTILHKIMEEFRDSARIVFLFQTQCTSSELLRYLLSELGVEYSGTDIVGMHKKLNDILFQEMLQGRRFVLIVDEAQNLDDSVLETIRLLSNFETTHSKLIQIVLAGQPELLDTLVRPCLSQLRQRISILTHLEPLGVSETAEYVQHRLRSAGFHGPLMFSPEALESIAERSGGVPRCINNICFNALLAGYRHHKQLIDSEIVREVATDLDMALLVKRTRRDTPENPPDSPEDLHEHEFSANAAQANGSSENGSSKLARLLIEALAGNGKQPDSEAHTKTRKGFALTGKLTEKLTSQSWGKKNEFRIQVSLEREYSPSLPIADHYYCRSFYVSEDQAVHLREGKQVRIKFEQD